MSRSGKPKTATAGTLALLAALAAVLLAITVYRADPVLAQGAAAVPGITITVDTEEDESRTDGDCSLREAVEAADTNAAVDGCAAGSARKRDAIRFSLGQRATIVLDSQLPAITDTSPLTVNGGREAEIVVSGGGKVRVLVVKKGARLALKNLAVAAGSASNGAGGGVDNRGGTLRIARSTFSGNEALDPGGAIANLGAAGEVAVVNSTFSGNGAEVGGAITNGGKLDVAYSTFSGNSAEFVGGAIQNANAAAARAKIGETIFANNLANDTKDNVNNACVPGTCRGKITDGGYNISDDKSFRFGAPTSRTNVDPRLEPGGSQDNGGPTDTIALQGDSPAVDFIPKGRNGCGAAVNVDQRGVKRPQGNRCDAGAFELQASPR